MVPPAFSTVRSQQAGRQFLCCIDADLHNSNYVASNSIRRLPNFLRHLGTRFSISIVERSGLCCVEAARNDQTFVEKLSTISTNSTFFSRFFMQIFKTKFANRAMNSKRDRRVGEAGADGDGDGGGGGTFILQHWYRHQSWRTWLALPSRIGVMWGV